MHTLHTVDSFVSHTPCHAAVYLHRGHVLFTARPTEGKDPLIRDCRKNIFTLFEPTLRHKRDLCPESGEQETERAGGVFFPPLLMCLFGTASHHITLKKKKKHPDSPPVSHLVTGY